MPTFIERKGSSANAGYWYRRAGRSPANDALNDEWDRIVSSLLGAGFPVLDDK